MSDHMVDCIFQEIGGLYQGVGKLFVLCTFPLLVLFKKVEKLLSLIMACNVFLSVSTYGYCLQRRYQERFHRKVEKDALYALQRTALKMMCIFSIEKLKRCVAGSLITELGFSNLEDGRALRNETCRSGVCFQRVAESQR